MVVCTANRWSLGHVTFVCRATSGFIAPARPPAVHSYVITADLDGDDDIDVVSASYVDGRIVWYENTDGAGTFADGLDIDVLESASSVNAVDLDNDGDLDLVASENDGGRLVWYENTDGQASFAAAVVIAIDDGVREVNHLANYFSVWCLPPGYHSTARQHGTCQSSRHSLARTHNVHCCQHTSCLAYHKCVTVDLLIETIPPSV